MRVKIRTATIKDMGEVLNLLKELKISAYQEMGLDVKVEASKQAESVYRKALSEKEASLVLVAEVCGKVRGVLVAYFIPKILDGGLRMLIEEMVVAKDFRSQGVGGLLLKKSEQEAVKRKIKVIKVTTGTRLKANKFYKKHGFTYFENAYRKKLA